MENNFCFVCTDECAKKSFMPVAKDAKDCSYRVAT